MLKHLGRCFLNVHLPSHSVLTGDVYLQTRTLWDHLFSPTAEFWGWFKEWHGRCTVQVEVTESGIGIGTPRSGIVERAIREMTQMLVEESRACVEKGKVSSLTATLWMHLVFIATHGDRELLAVWEGLSTDSTTLLEAKQLTGRDLRTRAKQLFSEIASRREVQLSDIAALLDIDRKVREKLKAAA